MTERARAAGPRVRHSVFAKLVAIMLAMAVSLLVLVGGFFLLYIVPASTHDFVWTVKERARTAHVVLLALLLLLVTAVVFATHVVLRQMLRPLRGLADGVARLGTGQLDVVVPRPSDDEFGDLTDAFNGMVARVREMIRARDQLLLDVSHELRSPVTRLKVALELVGDPGMKARMAGDLTEMEIMIGELIELERLRDGRGIRPARGDLVAILHDVARNYEDRPPGVRVVAAAPEIAVDVDADRMRTVVRNLVENAIKYSGPDSRAVEIRAATDADRVVIRVIDEGPGIPEADIPSLFEPFFRVDRSRSKKTGGFGLGLSIARRIVEAHGGTIAVQNNAGRGVSVIVVLPKPA
jgi:signal transduction histidine kinase